MVWFWYFLIYSFLGFLVEVAYVRLVGGVKRDRKCRLVLPICPVYGLGALAILLLPPLVRDSLPLLFPAAALVCTAVEYVTGLFYEKVFRVSFWDYSHLPLNLGGRVCLLFALFWGVLALLVLHVIHPAAAWLAARIPLWAFLQPCWPRRWTRSSPPGSCAGPETPILRWYARLPRRRPA
ncbi:MAG: putative ABC transporter permease [Flavonifractor plautii]